MISIGFFIFAMFLLTLSNCFWLFYHSHRMMTKDQIKNAYRDEALAWERTARQYYREYLNVKASLKKLSITPSETQTQVSWRVVFGFAKNANITKAEVNTRYKKLAMVHHPDQGGSNYGITLLNLAKEKADKEIK